MSNTEDREIPYKSLFRRTSSKNFHLKLFRCLTKFQKDDFEYSTFEQGTRRGLCLYHTLGTFNDIPADEATGQITQLQFEEGNLHGIACLGLPKLYLRLEGDIYVQAILIRITETNRLQNKMWEKRWSV